MTDANDRHKAKMEKRKAAQDAEVASKTVLEKGLLIVHTGPGKGKSTAAFGLALRALGRGFRVGVVQFIKGGWTTGERPALERFGDQIVWRTMGEGFTWETQDRARDVAAAEAAWEEAKRMMADETIRLVALDELNIALRYEYLRLADVVETLRSAPPRPARRRHRAQRQAGTDRGRRLRHRVRPRQTSFRRRGAGAGGDRVLKGDSVAAVADRGGEGRAAGYRGRRPRLQRRRASMTARALMFQGAGSDVGKSLIVAGLCRVFTRRGLAVRPFKPQNMSNNAAVTADGGEIGRAQALQALACGVPPTVDMNPVLLKPQSDIGAQVVVQGRVIGNAKAREYQALKPKLLDAVLASFSTASRPRPTWCIVEGAGSAAEINLRDGDIANMGFARAARCPVVLVADIDRGGVFAQVLGTAGLARGGGSRDHRGLHRQQVPRRSRVCSPTACGSSPSAPSWRAFGLVPFCSRGRPPARRRRLRASDGRKRATTAPVTIAVPALQPHRQFRRLRPLEARAVRAARVRQTRRADPRLDCVILPGSKATIADLAFFRAAGVGHRPHRPCPPRRPGFWDLRRLSDARQARRRSGGDGGEPRRGRGPRSPRRRDGADGRKDAGTGRGRELPQRRALRRLRNACRPDDRAGLRPSPACVSPTADSTAPSRRAAG